MKGPIRGGPTDYVVCVICSRLMSTDDRRLRVAVPKRHVKSHLENHRMGRIKRPTEAK